MSNTPQTDYIPSGNNFGVSADTIAANLDRLVNDGNITPDDKSTVMWLFDHARNASLSLADVGKLIGYSSTTVSRLFGGRYEGNYSDVIRKVRSYRKLADERTRLTTNEYIEISIWHSIKATCDLALIHQMPAMITGVSQIGKTSALLEYRRRSEYIVRYVRMPAAPGFRGAIEAIADSCGVTTRCTTEQLRRRIAKSLDNKSLLIVDELHQLAISAGKNSAMKIMEYIREVHDRSECGLVVCGTRALDQDLINGDLKGWLEQFRERCIRSLRLPDRLPDDDILMFTAAHSLPPPDSDTLALLRTMRTNRICKLLMLAGNLSRRRDQPMAWAHFNAAYAAVCQ
jgi:DNA transposition AAA+ family ATPase